MNQLRLLSPHFGSEECKWVHQVIFDELLGIPVTLEKSSACIYTLIVGEAQITWPDVFLRSLISVNLDEGFLHPKDGITVDVASVTDTTPSNLPVLFGEPRISSQGASVDLHFDISGIIFYFLSEAGSIQENARDGHERPLAVNSYSFRNNLLHRPVVDEYIELLRAMINKIWPGSVAKRNEGQIIPTCDVDFPFEASAFRIRSLARELLAATRGELSRVELNRKVANSLRCRAGNYQHDRNYTFPWYIDECERQGRQAVFYFISGHTGGSIDGYYAIEATPIVALLGEITRRGHDIGLHGSYNTFRSSAELNKERARLMQACVSSGHPVDIRQCRQHFLRWDPIYTPRAMEEAGLRLDSTGSYPDIAGFKYGTAHKFSMWDWSRRRALKAKQAPLILMESTVIAKRYQNLGYTEAALEYMLTLKVNALKYGGDFLFLWHNSHLTIEEDRRFFKILLQ